MANATTLLTRGSVSWSTVNPSELMSFSWTAP